MARGKEKRESERIVGLLYKGIDDEVIEMINNERNKAGLVRDLLYLELNRRKGNVAIIDTESYDKLSKIIKLNNAVDDEIPQNNQNIKTSDEILKGFMKNFKK